MSRARQANRVGLTGFIALAVQVAACETVSGISDFTVQGTSSDASADGGAGSNGDSGADADAGGLTEGGSSDGDTDSGADGPD